MKYLAYFMTLILLSLCSANLNINDFEEARFLQLNKAQSEVNFIKKKIATLISYKIVRNDADPKTVNSKKFIAKLTNDSLEFKSDGKSQIKIKLLKYLLLKKSSVFRNLYVRS